MANTRYDFTELLSAQAIGNFTTGLNVAIQVFNAKTGVEETLTSSVCTEIGTTGVFTWQFSNLDTLPAVFTQYLYRMYNTADPTNQKFELLDTGGWVEAIPAQLGPANTCKIYTTGVNIDALCYIETNDLSVDNYIELKTAAFFDSRYFKKDKYKPSYDQTTGQLFWIFPQGATVDIKLPLFGIDASSKTVPASSTVELNTLVTS